MEYRGVEGEGRGLGESCKGEEGWKGGRVGVKIHTKFSLITLRCLMKIIISNENSDSPRK